jgi:hypothetical protein
MQPDDAVLGVLAGFKRDMRNDCAHADNQVGSGMISRNT